MPFIFIKNRNRKKGVVQNIDARFYVAVVGIFIACRSEFKYRDIYKSSKCVCVCSENADVIKKNYTSVVFSVPISLMYIYYILYRLL